MLWSLLAVGCSAPDVSSTPFPRTVEPVLPGDGEPTTPEDSGLLPEPEHTGLLFGALTGDWEGGCVAPAPAPVPRVVPADVRSIRGALTETLDEQTTGELHLEVVWSPGGPIRLVELDAEVTGTREQSRVTLRLDAPEAAGLELSGQYDGDHIEGTLSIPAGVFGSSASTLDCGLQRS